MIKYVSRLFVMAAMLTCMASCSDDAPEDNRIGHLNDLSGLWLSEDNDFFIRTNVSMPDPVDFNSIVIYWNNQYTDVGSPLITTKNGTTTLTQGTLDLEISDFKMKKGTMTIYNPASRESKKFVRAKTGNVGIIANKTHERQSFTKCDIYVYAEQEDGTNILTYSAHIGCNDRAFPTTNGSYNHSRPFWLGGVKSTVIAKFTEKETGKTYTAEWNGLEPDTYYTLNF